MLAVMAKARVAESNARIAKRLMKKWRIGRGIIGPPYITCIGFTPWLSAVACLQLRGIAWRLRERLLYATIGIRDGIGVRHDAYAVDGRRHFMVTRA
jgi:hypothetical protein